MDEKDKLEQEDTYELTPAQIWFKNFELENGRKPTSDEFLKAKMRNFKKPISFQKVLLVASLSVVICLIIGAVVFQIKHQNKVKDAKITLNFQIKAAGSLKKEIDAAYLDDKSSFLKKTVTSQTLEMFDSKLKKLFIDKMIADKALKTLKRDYTSSYDDTKQALANLQTVFDAQTAVNELFNPTSPVLVEKVIKKDVAIVDDLDAEKVNQIDTKSFGGSEFGKAVDTLKAEALAQVKQIETARAAVNALFKDGKAQDDEVGYNKAKSEVDKIRNAKAKKELSDKLGQVKQVVDAANQKKEFTTEEILALSFFVPGSQIVASDIVTDKYDVGGVGDPIYIDVKQLTFRADKTMDGFDMYSSEFNVVAVFIVAVKGDTIYTGMVQNTIDFSYFTTSDSAHHANIQDLYRQYQNNSDYQTILKKVRLSTERKFVSAEQGHFKDSQIQSAFESFETPRVIDSGLAVDYSVGLSHFQGDVKFLLPTKNYLWVYAEFKNIFSGPVNGDLKATAVATIYKDIKGRTGKVSLMTDAETAADYGSNIDKSSGVTTYILANDGKVYVLNLDTRSVVETDNQAIKDWYSQNFK